MDEKARSTQAQNRCGPVVIGVAAAATVVLAVGGVCGYRAYEGHQVSVARQTCQSAAADLGKAVKTYKTLLGSDDTMAALKTDAKSVKDARTVDTLAKAAKAKLPAMVRCDASTVAGLDASAARASKAAKAVKADSKTAKTAVKAVETSKLDKTVDDAKALYKATDGKVQDDKTREALAKAVKARDAKAIAKAVKAVNESKAVKEKADAEAKAKTEQEAQAASGGSQSAGGSGYSSSSYSGGTASAGRSTGSTGGWSYSGGASGGSASSGNGGGASGGNGGSTSSSGGSNGGSSSGGTPSIPSTSGCTTSITGECSTAPGGEVWW